MYKRHFARLLGIILIALYVILPCTLIFVSFRAKTVKTMSPVNKTLSETNTIHSFSIQEITPTVIPSKAPIIRTREINVEEKEPSPTEPIKKESAFKYTPQELDLLARLVSAEGGVENYKCQLAIASIVMNRVVDKQFPDTIESVVYQREPGVQFSVILRSNGHAAIDRPASKSALKAAKCVLENGSILPPDVLVFYASYCDDGWVTSRKIYKQIDSTVFAYTCHK